MAATKFYLFEVRDSDGNDCTVLDVVVAADSREHASAKLWKELEACYPDDESDGGYGTFHACTCTCDHGRPIGDCEAPECDPSNWECSHGGLLTNEDTDPPYGPAEFATHAEAMAAHARYHSLIDLTETEG